MKNLLATFCFCILLAQSSAAQNEIKVGLIGLDTSHVPRFTQILNDPSSPDHVPGARVVAAFKGGSPDIESSATRIEKFTAEIRDKWKIEVLGSIEELTRKVDAVIITSVDGRVHLQQARPVFAARKRVFIDKPLAGNVKDALEIVRLARETGTPFFSSSSLRFSSLVEEVKKNTTLGDTLGAFTYGPAPTEPHHPDLFWYGIHAVEILYTLMGPGCESVSRVHTQGADVVVGRWKDGRTGAVRGIRDGAKNHGAVVFGSKSIAAVGPPQGSDYGRLVQAIVKFFQTGVSPVPPAETLEIMAYMEAADLSKSRKGAEVPLKELLTPAP